MWSKISTNRWRNAQKFELDEWKAEDCVVKNEWQEIAKKFSKLFPKVAELVRLKKGDEVLDVGCGPTVPARMLGKGKITGIEPLADKLGISGKNKITKGVEIVNGMAEDMPFKDGKFKLVVCRNVIDHTQDPGLIVDEIYRVAKKQGYLLLICYVYAPFIVWIKNLSEKFRFMNNVGHPFAYTPETLDKLVDGKFEIVERYVVYVGQHSTDYGKENIEKDRSLINKVLIWVNKNIFRSGYFLKEYGYLAKKI